MFADDISFSPGALTIIGAVVTALWVTLGVIGKLLLKSKDDQYANLKENCMSEKAELREQRDSYKKVGDRAVTTLELVSERQMIAKGGVPIPKIAALIPEANSPATERQKNAAEFGTLVARLVAAQLATGFVEEPKVE
jgi:hypothetical protein